MEKIETREMMSALADGQLHGEGFAHAVGLAAADPSAREAWETYHLIGDVLRSAELAAGTPSPLFLGRLQSRLRNEQRLSPAQPVQPIAVQARPAANDGNFRWKIAAGFASVAAVAAIGWNAVGSMRTEQGQVAAVPAGAVVATGERGVMIRDARLDEFLAAHRQLGGASVLQTPAGFVRNTTFEGAGR